MSILVTELVSTGIIFGSDKNITYTDHHTGKTSQPEQRTKILHWPTSSILFGAVGGANLDGLPFVEWLKKIENELPPEFSVKDVAIFLHSKVQNSWNSRFKDEKPEGLIIHLAGFSSSSGVWLPEVWHIANVEGIGKFGYTGFSNKFYCKEAFQSELEDIHFSELRRYLRVCEKNLKPFWFHQGFDYPAFNAMQEALKASFRYLCLNHPSFEMPTTLEEWEKHVKLQVLLYCSYFDAFHDIGNRFVGGGADVLSIPWPVE
ncbi:MAG: hypothetical protein K8S14_11040 [Actinomycetia bacterium]|nr:hypothetical protein [Actinomycetes bacterium]